MPLPVAAAVLPAAAAAASTAYYAAAAKHVAIHILTTENINAATSATIAYMITKFMWNSIPNWIKEDIAVQNLFQNTTTNKNKNNTNNGGGGGDELTNLASILEKLQALVESALEYYKNTIETNDTIYSSLNRSTSLGNHASDNQPTVSASSSSMNPYVHTSFLLYVQLAAQLHQLYPEDRKERYLLQPPGRSSLPHTGNDTQHNRKSSLQHKLHDYSNEEKKYDEPVDIKNNVEFINERMKSDTVNDALPAPGGYDGTPYSLKQIFDLAVWAYEQDRTKLVNELNMICTDLKVVQHYGADKATNNRPGYLGHFLAVNHRNRTVVIGIKGTSTLEDILTDCCGRSVPYNTATECRYNDDIASSIRIEVQAERSPKIIPSTSSFSNIQATTAASDDDDENDDQGMEVISGHERIWIEDYSYGNNIEDIFHQSQQYFMQPGLTFDEYDHNDDEQRRDDNTDDENTTVRCHEGILISTRRLADTVQSKVELYVLRRNYQLIICGHSLGAGAASLLAIILRTRLPDLITLDPEQQQERVKVYAFAPPPVVDYPTAVSSAPFITSFVNNADLIPRASLMNLVVFIEFLKVISQRMEELSIVPGVSIASTMAYLRQLAKGGTIIELDATSEGDINGMMIMTQAEVQTAMDAVLQKYDAMLLHPDHLYIPGRVLLLYEDYSNESNRTKYCSTPSSSCGSSSSSCCAGMTDNTTRCDTIVTNNTQPNDASTAATELELGNEQPICKVIETDGSAVALRFFELDSFRFTTDHTTVSYETSMKLANLM